MSQQPGMENKKAIKQRPPAHIETPQETHNSSKTQNAALKV